MRFIINRTLKFINQRIPTLIQTPRARSFGNCGEEIFYGLLKARRRNKKILFLHSPNLFSKRMTANKHLFDIVDDFHFQNKIVSFFGGWIIVILLIIVRPLLRLIGSRNTERLLGLNFRDGAIFSFYYRSPRIGRSTLWQEDNTSSFSWETVKELNWNRQYQDYVPPRLNKANLLKAERFRTQMGIPLSDWFVCLHVREGGYHNDFSSQEIRNASIQNYTEGINAINDAGGWVVRIGDSTMSPIVKKERVIDYPHTRFKSELMDIYLVSECRFYVGTNSGPADVATLFKKPTILVNASDWGNCFPVRKGDLFIPKRIFSHPLNRYLSITEIVEKTHLSSGYKLVPDDCVMVENTPQEIRDIIDEYLTKSGNFNYSDLQKSFNAARTNQLHRMLDQNDNFSTVGKYRFASRADAAAGTMGQKYLEQNWSYDDLQLGQSGQTKPGSQKKVGVSNPKFNL